MLLSMLFRAGRGVLQRVCLDFRGGAASELCEIGEVPQK